MDYKYIKISLIISLLIFLSACQQSTSPVANNDDNTNKTKFEFIDLVAESTSITIYQSPKIKAVAKGDELTYIWSAELGLIWGSGPEVNYSICHETEDIITCKVADKWGNSATKSIKIQSFEF
jgi:hypothetical protein